MNRVLIVGPLTPNGGWSHVVRTTVRMLDAAGCANELLDVSVRGDKESASRWTAIGRIAAQVLTFPLALLRRRPTTVVLCTGNGATFWRDIILMRVAVAAGYPVVVRLFGGEMLGVIERLPAPLRLAVNRTLGRAASILLETHETRQLAQQKWPGVPVHRVVNAVDRAALPARRGNESAEIGIVYFGSMVPEKGVELLLQAVEQLSARYPLRAHFIGSSIRAGYMTAFETRAGQSRTARIHVHGALPKAEAHAIAATCDVFVLASCWSGEGQPSALLEAMGMGLVPVVSNWRGIGEIVRHEDNGLVLEARDAAAIAAALERLINDEPLRARLADAACQTVARDYDIVCAGGPVAALLGSGSLAVRPANFKPVSAHSDTGR